MSRDGSIELQFGGDKRTFRLGIDELLALQDRRGIGLYEIEARFRSRTCHVQDVQEIIRLGLIGGGVEAKRAEEIAERGVKPGALSLCRLVALAVLLAAMQGDESDPVGKEPAASQVPGAATTASEPPPSTEPAPSSDSGQPKSDA